VRHEEEAPESAGLCVEALELGGRVVGIPDHGEATLEQGVDGSLQVSARGERERCYLPEVPQPALKPEAYVGACLLPALGDVHRSDEAPVRPVHLASVLLGLVGADLPVRGEGVEAAAGRRADGEQADAVLPGGASAGG
jgi:hypothetical protein